MLTSGEILATTVFSMILGSEHDREMKHPRWTIKTMGYGRFDVYYAAISLYHDGWKPFFKLSKSLVLAREEQCKRGWRGDRYEEVECMKRRPLTGPLRLQGAWGDERTGAFNLNGSHTFFLLHGDLPPRRAHFFYHQGWSNHLTI